MKINLLKKKSTLKKRDFTLNPELYWKIAIGVVFIMLIFFSFLGYFLFKQATADESNSLNSSDNVVATPIDTVLLNKVLKIFSTRDQTSTEIFNQPAPVDPSL